MTIAATARRRMTCLVVAVLLSSLVSGNAFADAGVPVVALFDLPVAALSVFWIFPLEAAIVRFREPEMPYGDLLWDFWLVNWLSLAVGAAFLGVVFLCLATLGALGVFHLFPRVEQLIEMIRPVEPDGSSRPFRTIFLGSLVWFALTMPLSALLEGRVLSRRWKTRNALSLHTARQHAWIVNSTSYSVLTLLLLKLFYR